MVPLRLPTVVPIPALVVVAGQAAVTHLLTLTAPVTIAAAPVVASSIRLRKCCRLPHAKCSGHQN
jgi:hypothetical protein